MKYNVWIISVHIMPVDSFGYPHLSAQKIVLFGRILDRGEEFFLGRVSFAILDNVDALFKWIGTLRDELRHHSPVTEQDKRTCILMSSPTSSPISKSKASSKMSRKSSSLPAETVEYLKNWMMSPEHIAHPYPTEQEKAKMMADTGIELKQLTNWFVNNRKRFWKPRVEARLQQVQVPVVAAATTPAVAIAAAASVSQAKPVTPDASKKTSLMSSVVSGVVSHDSATRTSMSRVCSQESITHADVVSESSVSASDSMSEGGDAPDHAEREVSDLPPCAVVNSDNKRTRSCSEISESVSETNKRAIIEHEDAHHTAHRNKFRRVSLETWRGACQEATNAYCDSLPTLEEAVRLFGYAN
eukprot:Nitzschia sp. Nitz4//scaffold76_size158648//69856//71384//NITZ4_002546-RA/size158648-snap-gene-0.287-mRNA-1//1//CDS//3329557845//2516//frame0